MAKRAGTIPLAVLAMLAWLPVQATEIAAPQQDAPKPAAVLPSKGKAAGQAPGKPGPRRTLCADPRVKDVSCY
jgi:hypothetical protein